MIVLAGTCMTCQPWPSLHHISDCSSVVVYATNIYLLFKQEYISSEAMIVLLVEGLTVSHSPGGTLAGFHISRILKASAHTG